MWLSSYNLTYHTGYHDVGLAKSYYPVPSTPDDLANTDAAIQVYYTKGNTSSQSKE
jgi:hypothetical protein